MTCQPFDKLRVDAELLSRHQAPQFKFVDRGFGKNILLIPGWATDYRIFERLEIPFNYLLPEHILPGEFVRAFESIPGNIKSQGIDLLGWSMGGFIAADLVSIYPSVFDRIILVSVRQGYDTDDIERIGRYLKRNACAYLYKFYGGFFSEDEEAHKTWFKDSLLDEYTENVETLRLFDGLDYLKGAALKTDILDNPNVTLVHGEDDGIAPLKDAGSVAAQIPRAKFISIKGARHLPYLRKEFRDIFGVNAYAG